mgnify:FL=1
MQDSDRSLRVEAWWLWWDLHVPVSMLGDRRLCKKAAASFWSPKVCSACVCQCYCVHKIVNCWWWDSGSSIWGHISHVSHLILHIFLVSIHGLDFHLLHVTMVTGTCTMYTVPLMSQYTLRSQLFWFNPYCSDLSFCKDETTDFIDALGFCLLARLSEFVITHLPRYNDVISKQCVSNYRPNELKTNSCCCKRKKCGNDMVILSHSWRHNTAQHQTFSWWAPDTCCKDFSWIQVEIPGLHLFQTLKMRSFESIFGYVAKSKMYG